MMNRRMIQSRFCATLSACALALALASPAWSADPAGQAEIQLAKNHIESLKKPMPALSGKALKAFQKNEKAFKARSKQKPPKPMTGKEMMDSCNKDKICREQLKFIEQEMKKKKRSGSLDFGLPELASALNPFQIKEAYASHGDWHVSTLYFNYRYFPFINLRYYGRTYFTHASTDSWSLRLTSYPGLPDPPTVMYEVYVPQGIYLFCPFGRITSTSSIEFVIDGVVNETRELAAQGYGCDSFARWIYFAKGAHTISIRLIRGSIKYLLGGLGRLTLFYL